MALKQFLADSKARLSDLHFQPKIHIVIGNESCDLDSAVSAIVYAYHIHKTRAGPDVTCLPVMTIPQKHFRLKLEVVYFLNKYSITANDLIFVDDIDLVALTQDEAITLTVTLVDHHDLSEAEQCLRDFVVEVLDHRPQNKTLPESWNPQIELVGSCCSLVARELLVSKDMDSTSAELLLGAILADTGNLSISDNVGTPLDHEVVGQLKSYLPGGTSAMDIYEEIIRAKFDLSSLTLLEMLDKDVKVLQPKHRDYDDMAESSHSAKGNQITVAMSSITVRLEDILSRPEFLDDCKEFCKNHSANVLIIMTFSKDGNDQSQRRIAVFSLNRIYRQQIIDVLYSMSPSLDLEEMTSYSALDNVSAFIQSNVHVSRKGVIPPIQDFVAGASTTPDENINAFDDSQLELGSLAEKWDISDEEVRRHINLAKNFHSDLFRTSQDMYDLAAVGTDAVISPSLSSDSEVGGSMGRRSDEKSIIRASSYEDITEEGRLADEEILELPHAYIDAKTYDSAYRDNGAAGDSRDVDTLDVSKDAIATGDGSFVNNLIDFGSESNDIMHIAADNLLQVNVGGGFADQLATIDDVDPFIQSNIEAPKDSPTVSNMEYVSGAETEATPSNEETRQDFFTTGKDNMGYFTGGTDTGSNTLDGDILHEHSPLNLLCPNIDSPLDFSSMPTSGQGSKMPSYPETPPNSCMEPSEMGFYKETQLPSFNSLEMVKRIHEKKAALAGFSSKHKKGEFIDEEGLYIGGESSSGGGGSLISPAVPQNSYVDLVTGFDFQPSGYQPSKLVNSDIIERVNEKLSQFEWSIESLEGSTSGVDVGPNSDEGAQKALFGDEDIQHISLIDRADPQTPYTPQNSYVEENFDSYARNNLPSMNSAEIVAKIIAKQSAMFGSGNSSRVSRSSHGSDDSGGCRSPDVVVRSPRAASVDSPQAPYTPQNSYRDNLGLLDAGNHLPDLNEVAERLSTENASKRQFGKRSTSNSGGGSRDEDNINLNIHQQSHVQRGRNSSSQSDSQNTMSDVESLMSVSTDVGTPSENIVAAGLAREMRSEIALLSRKDTNDSDVFPTNKAEEAGSSNELVPQRVNVVDFVASDKMSNRNVFHTGKVFVDSSGTVHRNGYAGSKELFSPVDSAQVLGIEDHAIFEVAESIVAQSVAAAIQASHKEAEVEGWKREEHLKWYDSVQSNGIGFNDSHRDPEHLETFSPADDEEDDDTMGVITENFPDHHQGTLQPATHNTSQTLADEINHPVLSNHSALNQELLTLNPNDEHEEEGQQKASKSKANENQALQNKLLSSSLSHEMNTDSLSLGEQNIADLALNELAFELASELIHSALEHFPVNEDFIDDIQADAQVYYQEANAEPNRVGFEESPTQILPKVELDSSPKTLGNGQMETYMLNVSGNSKIADSGTPSSDVLTIHDGSGFDTAVSGLTDEVSKGWPTSNDDKDNQSLFLESKKYSISSLDSNSSSSSAERKRSKETDSSMTILEDEIMNTFPGRSTSAELMAAEEEEIILSFPGRKFSKSEDFPPRRFSRDDNSSRRSSKLDDSDLEVNIGPQDIETDYLPYMDPLQGSLDIIDASYTKITDSDREVVEGESFRKVSGQEYVSSDDEGSQGNEDTEEDEIQKLAGDALYNSERVAEVSPDEDSTPLNDSDNIPHDGLSQNVLDLDRPQAAAFAGDVGLWDEDTVSKEECQTAVGQAHAVSHSLDKDSSALFSSTNGFIKTDVPREAEEMSNEQTPNNTDGQDREPANIFDEQERIDADIFVEQETGFVDSFNKQERDATDNFSDQGRQIAQVYNEQEKGVSSNFSEQEKDVTDIFVEKKSKVPDIFDEPAHEVEEINNEQDKEVADIYSERHKEVVIMPLELNKETGEDSSQSGNKALLDDSRQQESLHMVEEVKTPKQKKKIRVSFSEDLADESDDHSITSSSRSPLRSPPPPQASDDPATSLSFEDYNAAADEEVEDNVSPFSSSPTDMPPPNYHNQQMREIHITADHMDLAGREQDEKKSLTADHRSSPPPSSTSEQMLVEEDERIRQKNEAAPETVLESSFHDVNVHLSESPFSRVSAALQSDMPTNALQSPHETTVKSENDSHTFTSTEPNMTFGMPTSDLTAHLSNHVHEACMDIDSDGQDIDSCIQHQPASSLTTSFTHDPFSSIPTHARSLSSASVGSVQGAVYSEEWQDDDIVEVAAQSGLETSACDPMRHKIASDSTTSRVSETDTNADIEDEDENRAEDEDSEVGDLEWENDTPVKIPVRPGIEPTFATESTCQIAPRWKRVSISGADFDIDMQAVEPFRNVLSHGGYYDEGLSAIIVFYGCNLPSRRRGDYAYIMNHLFHYVIHTLEELVADDYVIIYFHGSTPRRQMPSLGWFKRCYQSIDRRLKKNLKGLFLVHPTLWLKTVVTMTKPFISTKFSSKLRFVRSLEELNGLVPLNNVTIPDAVVHYDIHHQTLTTPPASPPHPSHETFT